MAAISPLDMYKIIVKLPGYGLRQRELSSIIQELRKYSYCNLNKKDKNGKVLLYYAVRNHETDIITVLLNVGANVNVKDECNRTLLHYAIIYYDNIFYDAGVIPILLNAGVDVNVKDEDGRTPLHLAASNNHVDIAELLIEQGANIDVQDKNGNTPLHLAASNNCEYVTWLFIKQGADILTKNVDNRRPIDMCSNKKAIELLSQHAQAKHKQYSMDTAVLVGLNIALIAVIGTTIYFTVAKESKPSLPHIMLPVLIILLSSVIVATAYTFKEKTAYKKAITTELNEVEIKQISKNELKDAIVKHTANKTSALLQN